MARTGVSEMDPGAAVVELKRELKRVVKVIVEEEELDLDVIDRAKDVLFALRDLKAKRAAATAVMAATAVVEEERESAVAVPEEFRCPLSKEVMRDPVIVATGQTYDRPFIQRWLKAGHRTCPLTQQVLSHTLLTPNYLVSELISQWFKTHGLDPPGPTPQLNEDDITDADRDHFFSLLEKMSSPVLEQQKAAAKEVRLLTKRIPAFRALFGESPNAIHQLLNPLRNSFVIDHNQDLQEDIITTLLNISIHDSNKKLVAEMPMVIPLLINALTRGPIETRSNSAATLFTLSALDSNKVLIGKSGALKPLLDLIDEGHPLAIKDAASAVFNLCINQENRARAVRDGAAIRVILSKITSGVHVDELLAILAMLSTNHRAVEELTQLGAISILLSIMKETSCGRNKENCIAILYAICVNDRSRLREMREEERENGTLSQLAQDGTSRAKRKATGILDRLNRAVHFTHTA